jgi:hypothetical protein
MCHVEELYLGLTVVDVLIALITDYKYKKNVFQKRSKLGRAVS